MFRPALLAVALLALAGVPQGTAFDQPADGVTAIILLPVVETPTIPDLSAHAAMVAQDGTYTVRVRIFEQEGVNWSASEMQATLRVFEDTTTGAIDRVSIPFTSDMHDWTNVTFSADAVGDGPLDIFVTFSELGGEPVPTSHYFAQKTLVYTKGWYNNMDSLDHHSTRVIAL